MAFFNPDMEDMLDVFQTESRELMDRMETYLMTEEKQNRLSTETLQGIFRIVHTMKSSSAMMGLEEMSRCTHRLEDLFLIYRDEPEKTTGLEGHLFDLLYTYVDYVREEMDRIQEEEYQPATTDGLVGRINEELELAKLQMAAGRQQRMLTEAGQENCREQGTQAEEERNGHQPEQNAEGQENVRTERNAEGQENVRTDRSKAGQDSSGTEEKAEDQENDQPENDEEGWKHGKAEEMSGAHGDYSEKAGESHGKVSSEHYMQQEHVCQWKIYLKDDCQMENVRAFLILKQIQSCCGQLFSTPENLQEKEAAIQIRKGGLLLYFTTNEPELVYQKLASSVYVKAIEDLGNSPEKKKSSRIAVRTEQKKERPEEGTQTVNKMGMVSWQKILLLQNVTGELITLANMLEKEIGGQKFSGRAGDLVRNNRNLLQELEGLVNAVSLTPVSGMVHQYSRAIRDICKKEEKDISFQVQGAELEVDKTLIDSLTSPLLHLIRNAADHGIEAREERKQTGKPATGKILFSVFSMGENLFFSVSDDGRGLDKKQILDKAEESGILKRPREEYTEEEIYQFIFRSGFSTSQSVTEFSGRGVGLDVVQKVVDRLHGSVYVESHLGEGTTITVSVPVSLTSIDSIQVSVEEHICFLPTKNVEQIYNYRQSQGQITQIDGNEYFRDEELIPLVRLRETYGYLRLEGEAQDQAFIITLQGIRHRMAIVVDQIWGQYTIVEKTLPDLIPGEYKRRTGINGCAVTAEGTIGYILNVDWIMRAYERGELYE